MTEDSAELRRRRLLYRATHRGTQENDLLIGTFVRRRVDALTDAELDELERIMELPEPLLADILTGRETVPADAPLLAAMVAAARSGVSRPA